MASANELALRGAISIMDKADQDEVFAVFEQIRALVKEGGDNAILGLSLAGVVIAGEDDD